MRNLFLKSLLTLALVLCLAAPSTAAAQLGHKSAKSTHQYAHLGQRAQLRLVADLEPSTPPHVNVRSTRENR